MRIIAHIGDSAITEYPHQGMGSVLTTLLSPFGWEKAVLEHFDTSVPHTPANDPTLVANQALIDNMKKTLDSSGTTDAANTMYAQANKIHQALISAGIKEPAASYATYQSFHETGGWPKSYALYWQHNNGSGIKYAGQQNANKLANGYAGFADFTDWVRAYVHELKKKANPAAAQSLEDFAHRLKLNGYYGASESNYLNGLKRARLVLTTMPAADKAYGNSAAKPEWEQWIENHKLLAGGAAAAFLLLLLSR